MPDIDTDLEQPATEEASHPSLDSSLVSDHHARSWIKAFALLRSKRVLLDVETESEERGKRVRQVQEHGRRDDADEAEIIGNGGGDDECYDPPDGNDRGVDNLAGLGGERRRVEDV